MNNKGKVKYILSLIIFFLVAFAFIFGAFFNIAKRSIPSASAEGVTYSLSEDGTTLTISGTGEVTRNDVSANIGSATNVVIEDGLTSIGNNAFRDCSSLESITIPDSVTSIGNYAFYSCKALQSITIPDSVTSIGDCAFESCNSLQSITIPDSVTSIGNYAFYSCEALQSITIPDSVTSIGNYAFYSCGTLQSITIPDSVTSIGEGAFRGCVALQSITIPDSVTSIGEKAFYWCRALQSITFKGTSFPELGSNVFSNVATTGTVYLNENLEIDDDTALSNLRAAGLPNGWSVQRVSSTQTSDQGQDQENPQNPDQDQGTQTTPSQDQENTQNPDQGQGTQTTPSQDQENTQNPDQGQGTQTPGQDQENTQNPDQNSKDKSPWGREVIENGATYYVRDDGTTSALITGTDGIYWLKEESYDPEQGKITSAWYGVDNSSGVFEPGSRLCVKWINKQENPEEWDEYHPMIDESETQNISDSKKWLFIAEVIHPDGVTKYTVLPNSVPFYVQLGDDWDIEDIEARFISPNEDEALETTYVKSLAYPAGTDKFMKLDLLHFSPYVIYDKDNPSITENIETKEQPENKNYYVWIIVGGLGIISLATLWWILYRKKKRNKENK